MKSNVRGMKSNVRGSSFRSARVLIAIALASTMLAGGSAAVAGGEKAGGSAVVAGGDKKNVFVSGNSTASDCGLPGSDWAISLTGDLEGCWSSYVRKYKCKELEDYDLYLEEGREVFVGKYHGKPGRFRTTYTLAGAYEKGVCQSGDFSLEVGGGCRHKIQGGSRVFAEAEGLIKFIDVIAGVTGDPTTGEFHAGTGGNNFLYYGRIDLIKRTDQRSRPSNSSTAFRVAPGPSARKAVPVQAGVVRRVSDSPAAAPLGAGGCGGRG